jgi:Sec-independent protein translocase protein TatA
MLPGGAEWIIIGGVVLVLFGASAVRRLGSTVRDTGRDVETGTNEPGARKEA